MESLRNRTALISGGTTGLGRATALLLAREGVMVYVFGRRQETLNQTLEAIHQAGGIAYGLTADVSVYSEVERVFQEVDRQFGHLDILVNNAAVPANNIFNTPPEDWEKVFTVNVLGYLNCSKLAVERMRTQQSGHILNIGSLCTRVVDNGSDLYMASKSAVMGFTDSLRKEVASDGIKVTLLNPGQMASEMVSETADEKEALVKAEKMLLPEDVAEAVLFCLSRNARVDLTHLDLRPHGQSTL